MREQIESLFNLDGKVAIVTGGNGGIGRVLGRSLAAAGASLVIAGRNQEGLKAVAGEIAQDLGCEALGVVTDVRKPADIDRLVNGASERFGRIDIVVANAGIAIERLPQELTVEEWDDEINSNLRHTFLLAKAAYPHLLKSGGGKIITLGSMTSIFGIASLPSYGASKGGILQLTRGLAVAWARDNIQVNCMMPGFIDPGLAGVPRREVPGFDEAVVRRTPACRWGEPADLAGTIVFLSSRASDFITGAAIPIDGGYAIQG
jgi:2-deoxy-D-gluconate 3-dehydrogenase